MKATATAKATASTVRATFLRWATRRGPIPSISPVSRQISVPAETDSTALSRPQLMSAELPASRPAVTETTTSVRL